jgi:hypothetical protein
MKTNWQIKSVLAGIIIGGGIIAIVGAALDPSPPGHLGRFQIAPSGNGGGYVLDTASGQVWTSADPAEFKAPKIKMPSSFIAHP